MRSDRRARKAANSASVLSIERSSAGGPKSAERGSPVSTHAPRTAIAGRGDPGQESVVAFEVSHAVCHLPCEYGRVFVHRFD